MDPLSSVMLRAALIWLLVGVVIERRDAHLSRPARQWRLGMAPSHAHMLFVGWFSSVRRRRCVLAAALAGGPGATVGLPRRNRVSAVGALNLGLVLRIIAESAQRTGHESDLTMAVLTASALLQVAAALMFIVQLMTTASPCGRYAEHTNDPTR